MTRATFTRLYWTQGAPVACAQAAAAGIDNATVCEWLDGI
jgi:hypothetical protein